MRTFILKILNKFKLLKFLNLTYTIKLNQEEIVVPIHGSIGFNNLTISEPWMIEVLQILELDQEELFIDVGVNIGQTLIKLKSVYSSMDYVGFEPNPSCVYYVESLINYNRWDNIHLVPSGVSETIGVGILEHYADDIADSSASIVSNYRSSSTVYKKDIVTLLDVQSVEHIWDGKKVSMIKIDVEGAELGVIKSFQHILEKDRPYLLVEILPVYDRENKERLDSQIAIEKILDDLAYKIYRIHKDSNHQLESIELIDLIGIHSNLDWCDYIFSPKVLSIS